MTGGYYPYYYSLWTIALLLAASSFCHASVPRPSAFLPKTQVEESHEVLSKYNGSTVTTTTTVTKNVTDVLIPQWKRDLPAPLNNKTKTLQRITLSHNDKLVHIYVLGTAHVSRDSSRDVRLLLETIQPTVLFLELCDQRIPMMMAPPAKPTNSTTEEENNNTAASKNEEETKGFWKKFTSRKKKKKKPAGTNSMYGMAASLLADMQVDYAESLGAELGGEFRVAYEYWEGKQLQRQEAVGGTNLQQQQQQQTETAVVVPHMILGDRPLYLTLTRAWESLRLWGKTKLIVGLFLSSLRKPNPEEIKEWMESILRDDSGDLLTQSIAELAEHFPSLERVIIQERDAYMACKLHQSCRQLFLTDPQTKYHTVVAVVGAGHVEGMCDWLTGKKKGPQQQQRPDQVLDDLIKIRKSIPQEDRDVLVHEVMEVNYEMLQEMARQAAAEEEQNDE